MKNIKRNQFIVALVLLGALSIGIGVWASAESYEIDRVRIENKTRSLIVESVTNKGDFDEMTRFQISVKNCSEKPIAIYRLRIKDAKTDKNTVNIIEKSGLGDGWTLKPNETSTMDFAAAHKGEVLLTVGAVLFEDGNGDGDATDIEQLQDIRLGIKMAYEKVVTIFNTKKAETNFTTDEILQSIQNEIRQTKNEIIPMNNKSGFTQALNYINFEIDNIRTTPLNTRKVEEFENFQAKIEKILAGFAVKIETNPVTNRRQK